MSSREYEYRLERQTRKPDEDYTTVWEDASGFNNKNGGLYYDLRAIKAQKTRIRQWEERWNREVRFRVLRRKIDPTSWEEIESD